jgi:gluconolactonase
VIDLDGSMRTLSDGVMLTNGLGVSPDGARLYHSDARAGLVRVYDVKPDGSVGPWRTFCTLGEGRIADGLKVAADGSVWVADARGARVAVFEADGAHRADIAVPLPMVTSLCFAGGDLRDLYIVTGSEGGPSETCGSIFRTRTEVAGLPLAPARVAI